MDLAFHGRRRAIARSAGTPDLDPYLRSHPYFLDDWPGLVAGGRGDLLPLRGPVWHADVSRVRDQGDDSGPRLVAGWRDYDSRAGERGLQILGSVHRPYPRD